MGEIFSRERPRSALDFTGERLTTATTGQVEIEHYHRYFLAREICRDKDVLDIASGEGYGSAFLAQVARSVVGVELNPEVAGHAGRVYSRGNLGFVSGDVRSIPLQDASVDVVVSFETLEHVYEHDAFLAEARRVLRPNGVLLISTPDRDIYSPSDSPANPFHVRELTKEEFTSTLRRTFRHVTSLSQRPMIGSVMLSDEIPVGGGRPITFERRGEDRFEASQGLPRAVYAVALASDQPFELPLAAFYIESSNLDTSQKALLDAQERVRQEHLQCERFERELADLRADHQRLTASTESLRAENQRLTAGTESLRAENASLGHQLTSANARLEGVAKEALNERTGLEQKLDSANAQLRTFGVQEASLRTAVAALRQELSDARRQLEGIFASPAWKIIERYRNWVARQRKARPRSFARYEKVALWTLGRIGRQRQAHRAPDRAASSEVANGGPTESHIPPEKQPSADISKLLLVISGCPGDSYRYRAEHQAEELALLGLTVDTALFDAVDYDNILGRYTAFILHRVPHTPGIEDFIKRAKVARKPVIFDTDDLVFNQKYISDVKALRDFSPAEYELFVDGIKRYNRTLSLCDAALVSTEPLRERIRELFPGMPVYVNRNAVSDEMVRQADFVLEHIPKIDSALVRIIYMSGTKTHNEDFAQCVAALDRVLEAYPQVRLMLVGHLDIPEQLRRWTDRLEVIPLVPWRDLPELMRRADINLAPLELDNAFTECKSELKYFEAGLLELPTVASQLEAYRFAITSGENGFLCQSEAEWFEAIAQLIVSRALRRRIGAAARQDVLARYTTRSRAPALVDTIQRLFADLRIVASRRLSIAIVTRAPIAQTGGGYKNIFMLANQLAARGHDVHIYVEAIAHLTGLSDAEIVAFCHQHFGASAARIHVGHDQILPSDVAIATNYPTAFTVDDLTNTKCKAYLIQDFEPDFFAKSDPEYQRAERTYTLPLKKIALGKYLQTLFSRRDKVTVSHIPFSLDSSVFRNLGSRRQFPIRVLFFARPGLKRRAYPVGVEALRILAKACPEVEIALYGMSAHEDLGFRYQNLGELSREAVAREMNRSHIHLSFSLTNISWVPFEAMACGCAVVEAKVPSVELWMEGAAEDCVLVDPDPPTVADALIKLVRDPDVRARIAACGEKYVAKISASWEETCAQLERILLDAVLRSYAPVEGMMIASRTGGFGHKVFYLQNGKRRPIPDPEWAQAHGLRLPEDVQLLSDEEINRLPLGGYTPRDWTAADRKSPPAGAPLREIAVSQLAGSGVEFGAGDTPTPIPLGCHVSYADRLSRDDFALQYHPGEQVDAVTPALLTSLCEMEGIAEQSLDFVIACHVLEHTPNPLLAFRAAYSRLKPGGQFVLVVPDKRYTFDKERWLTSLEHLIQDYDCPSSERDREHWEEWYTKVFPVPAEQLESSITAVLGSNGDIHYHTWTYESFKELVRYACEKVAPWSSMWSYPPRRDTEEGIEFYFVLTK